MMGHLSGAQGALLKIDVPLASASKQGVGHKGHKGHIFSFLGVERVATRHTRRPAPPVHRETTCPTCPMCPDPRIQAFSGGTSRGTSPGAHLRLVPQQAGVAATSRGADELSGRNGTMNAICLKENNGSTNPPCTLCGARCEPSGMGGDFYLEGTPEMVCDECAERHAPGLYALVWKERANP